MRVDGGAAANDLLLQFQADLLGIPVFRPRVLKTTALGAAYLDEAARRMEEWKRALERARVGGMGES